MRGMLRIAFFDAKPYDRHWFDRLNENRLDIHYFETRLDVDSARLAEGMDAVVAFVNDTLSAPVIAILARGGVRLVALRCAGFNNVDLPAARGRLRITRVPSYSPAAVAEHAAALLLCLDRKIHRAYTRTREHNFSLTGLVGFTLSGKTCGVVGTGRIGQAFARICAGFGMRVLAHDPYPNPSLGLEYVPLRTLLAQSDVVSLHCPLTPDTRHLIDAGSLLIAKRGMTLLNTSRGALVDTVALLAALKDGRVRAAGLDVYEEETDLFFEDHSGSVIADDTLALLISQPNVLVTSHQGFLTDEALSAIAESTLSSIFDFFAGKPLENELHV